MFIALDGLNGRERETINDEIGLMLKVNMGWHSGVCAWTWRGKPINSKSGHGPPTHMEGPAIKEISAGH
jgi:hypothetical protein